MAQTSKATSGYSRISVPEGVNMKKDEAIAIAREHAFNAGYHLSAETPRAIFSDQLQTGAGIRQGWTVQLLLNVPPGFTTDLLMVDVLEPNGQVEMFPVRS